MVGVCEVEDEVGYILKLGLATYHSFYSTLHFPPTLNSFLAVSWTLTMWEILAARSCSQSWLSLALPTYKPGITWHITIM